MRPGDARPALTGGSPVLDSLSLASTGGDIVAKPFVQARHVHALLVAANLFWCVRMQNHHLRPRGWRRRLFNQR